MRRVALYARRPSRRPADPGSHPQSHVRRHTAPAVHRGVWVFESIIGKPPPPPPANVPALNTPAAGSPQTTVREKLELHRSDANCSACHRKIDPLGLAFDNYDAIGRWRTVETVRDGSGADPKLDPSGELYDGRKFADASGLKHLLLDDIDRVRDRL